PSDASAAPGSSISVDPGSVGSIAYTRATTAAPAITHRTIRAIVCVSPLPIIIAHPGVGAAPGESRSGERRAASVSGDEPDRARGQRKRAKHADFGLVSRHGEGTRLARRLQLTPRVSSGCRFAAPAGRE